MPQAERRVRLLGSSPDRVGRKNDSAHFWLWLPTRSGEEPENGVEDKMIHCSICEEEPHDGSYHV